MEKVRDAARDIKLTENVQDCPNIELRIILRTKIVGSGLTGSGTIVIATVLTGMEFREFLCPV